MIPTLIISEVSTIESLQLCVLIRLYTTINHFVIGSSSWLKLWKVGELKMSSSNILAIDVEDDRKRIGKFHHGAILGCACLKVISYLSQQLLQNQCLSITKEIWALETDRYLLLSFSLFYFITEKQHFDRFWTVQERLILVFSLKMYPPQQGKRENHHL